MLEVIDKGSATESHPVPLLFVHGAWHAAWCWEEHFLEFFADKGFRAVAVSLRGHGASPLSKPLNSCSLPDYVDDVRTTVDMLGSEEPVLIGHSLGCLVVHKYLETYPAPAAVLMAPSTSRGARRTAIQMFRRHPWIFLRSSAFGDSANLVNTPALCRESLFHARTPEPIVKSCAARMMPESTRAGIINVRPSQRWTCGFAGACSRRKRRRLANRRGCDCCGADLPDGRRVLSRHGARHDA